MSSNFNSFDQSKLGAFIQSPLGVRNFEDQGDGTLVIAGLFGSADGNITAGVCRLDEENIELIQVSPLGFNQDAFDTKVINGVLNVVGRFTKEQGNAKDINLHAVFNTTLNQWDEAPGGPMSGSIVNAITPFEGGAALVGAFVVPSVANTTRVVKHDGSNYSAIGVPNINSTATSAVVFQGDLHVGGIFNLPGDGVARFKGGVWEDIFSGPAAERLVRRDVLEMVVFNDKLYLGGDFQLNGGNRVVSWDGTEFDNLEGGADDNVDAFVVFNGELIVGGRFNEVSIDDATPITANSIAKWDGSSWSAMGTFFDAFDNVEGLHVHNGTLYATGGIQSKNIYKFNGSDWEEVTPGSGLNSAGQKMTSFTGFTQ